VIGDVRQGRIVMFEQKRLQSGEAEGFAALVLSSPSMKTMSVPGPLQWIWEL
jgi:hypothetical protein